MARPKKTKPELDVLTSPTALKPLSPLILEEREKLRLILNDPIFVKAWQNAALSKPSVFRRDGQFDSPLGNQLASNRLHQIQGWEMFAAAILTQVNDPRPPKQEIPYTYTNE